MKTKLQPWLMALTCLLMAGSALANTNIVTTLADGPPGSLRAALPGTSAGGTIIFQVTGTILLTNELKIGRSLNIVGTGATNLNISGNHKGRVFNISSGTTNTISGLTISGGEAINLGGGILNAGNLTLLNCTVRSNLVFNLPPETDGDGGGMWNSGTLTLINCLVSDNYVDVVAIGSGGGIENSDGTIAMTNCTVSYNSIISSNGGSVQGGGIYLDSGFGSLVNCTIVSNASVGGVGGGIGLQGNGFGNNYVFISCTVSGNSCGDVVGGASGSGGGFGAYGGAHLTLENTIVSGNSATTGPDVAFYLSTLTSGGFNLIGLADGSSGWISSDLTGSTNAAYDPQLGPLQDNGGPTPTMAPALSSLVIDQGKSFGVHTDQRGSPRPLDYPNIANAAGGDGSDIGAVESIPDSPLLYIQLHHRYTSPTSYSNVTSSSLTISYAKTSPGTGSQKNLPIFIVQVLTASDGNPLGGGGAQPWTALHIPTMKLINNNFVTRDEVVASSAFYRLIGPSNNPDFILPPVTGSASNITTTAATLTGTVTPGGSNTVYWFEWGTDTNYYGGTTPTNSLDTSTNPVPVSGDIYGLTPSTPYHFQLVVMDDWDAPYNIQYGGDQSFPTADPVASSAPAVSTTPGPQVFSNCPTCFSASLHGTVDPEGGPTVAWFYYYSASDNFTGETTPQNVGSGNGPNGFQQAVFNLTPNTTYQFQIWASNSVGTSYGNYQSFTTAPPVPPAAATSDATYLSGGFNDFAHTPVLNGTVNGNGASFTGYFQYSTDMSYSMNTSQYPFSGNNSSPQSFSFTMTNVVLNAPATYHYRIVAFNGPSEGVGGDKTFTTP